MFTLRCLRDYSKVKGDVIIAYWQLRMAVNMFVSIGCLFLEVSLCKHKGLAPVSSMQLILVGISLVQ